MKRILTLDMLRGFALLCIMLDHMPISVLRNLTLSTWTMFDAAELFMLLSGFLVGLVWTMEVAKRGEGAAMRRFWRRSFQVWRALIIGAVLMALLSAGLLALDMRHTAIWNEYARFVIEQPFWFIAAVGSLWMQPNVLDILSTYVVLIAIVPLVMPLMTRWPWAIVGGSILVWAYAIPLNSMIPNQRHEPGFVFNPFGWQILFFTGAGMGLYRRRLMEELQPYGRWLTAICIVILIFGVNANFAPKLFANDHPVREFNRLIMGPVDKWSLDGMRFLSIMAATWLIAGPLSARMERLSDSVIGRAMAEIGRGGLFAFVACVLLSVFGDGLDMLTPAWPMRLAIDIWCITALWCVSALWMRRTE